MLVPFIGYTYDRRFMGFVRCDRERLSDLLQRQPVIALREAYAENLADEQVVSIGDVELACDDLMAIEAPPPQGDAQRRILTVRHRLQVQLGPYTVLGHLHSVPGAQPLATLARRAPMVPLSDATLAYLTGGELRLRDVSTLIINRDLADWVRASEADAAAFPGVPVLTEPAT